MKCNVNIGLTEFVGDLPKFGNISKFVSSLSSVLRFVVSSTKFKKSLSYTTSLHNKISKTLNNSMNIFISRLLCTVTTRLFVLSVRKIQRKRVSVEFL